MAQLSTPAGQLVRVPAQQRDRLAEGEAVGHAGHVGHGGPHRVFTAGQHVVVRAVRPVVGNEVGPVREVLDEGAQHRHDGLALAQRRLAQVDALVVAGPEGGQRLGLLLLHAHLAGAQRRRHHAVDEGAQLRAAAIAAPGRARPAGSWCGATMPVRTASSQSWQT